jgi:uncharacterized protein with GYD domain
MSGYIVMYKWTEQGRQRMTTGQGVESTQQHKERLEKMGIRTIGLWVTMGEYDSIGVYDAPDDITMASALMGTLHHGNATTLTFRAFSEEEAKEILGKMG